jgi:hypothetical protein
MKFLKGKLAKGMFAGAALLGLGVLGGKMLDDRYAEIDGPITTDYGTHQSVTGTPVKTRDAIAGIIEDDMDARSRHTTHPVNHI